MTASVTPFHLASPRQRELFERQAAERLVCAKDVPEGVTYQLVNATPNDFVADQERRLMKALGVIAQDSKGSL